MNTKITVVALLTALLLFAPLASAAQHKVISKDKTIGKPAADFTLKTHDGKSLTLSKLEGKRGAVLVFFATWCPACMAEVPQVKKFVDLSKDKNVLVYGVNIDQSKRIVSKFVKDHKVNYRILLDKDGKVARKYNVTGIPTIIGIDGKGIVRYRAHALPRDTRSFIKTLTADLPKKTDSKDEANPADVSNVEKPTPEKAHDSVRFVTKEKLQAWMMEEAEPLVIDVLSPEAYATAHIDGAVNIPLAKLKARAATLEKTRRTVVYCANYQCHASTQAAKLLTSMGFTDVYDYKGGIKEWTEAGLPVVSK